METSIIRLLNSLTFMELLPSHTIHSPCNYLSTVLFEIVLKMFGNCLLLSDGGSNAKDVLTILLSKLTSILTF